MLTRIVRALDRAHALLGQVVGLLEAFAHPAPGPYACHVCGEPRIGPGSTDRLCGLCVQAAEWSMRCDDPRSCGPDHLCAACWRHAEAIQP